ncbi:cytochrome c biogenesis CcdA family protein [Chelatococcus albus]|uniref:cytochrome c biogenesis CcdA family protein n=1 Tax=Chelatococcus albus TaxID=3047466 RepID=UPI003BEF06DB
MLLGAGAILLGGLLNAYRYELNVVGGAIIILSGFFLTGLARPARLMRDHRFQTTIPGGRPGSAYVLGLAFAFGWTSCIGPIPGAILTVSASSVTLTDGMALLAVDSAGLGPFVVAAAFTHGLAAKLEAVRRLGGLHWVAGGVMIAMGFAMITGRLAGFALWLLETFPVLATIG